MAVSSAAPVQLQIMHIHSGMRKLSIAVLCNIFPAARLMLLLVLQCIYWVLVWQIIFANDARGSRLLQARMRMQQRYLEQFFDLYEDFHIVQLPLLEEEVRGTEAIREFSANLLRPYQHEEGPADEQHLPRIRELEQANAQLSAQCALLQRQLSDALKT